MAVRDKIRDQAQQGRGEGESTSVGARPRSILDVLASDATRAQIAMALPPSLDVDRFLRMSKTAVKLDPDLMACTADSFVAALHKAAMYGLEPGTGQCYLQRYKQACTLVIGYRGIIELARRSGRLKSIEARAVRQGDDFDYAYGLDERLYHKPALEDPGELVCFYGIAKFQDGGHYWLVVNMAEILRHRDRSEAWLAKERGKGSGGPWASDFEAMARKTVIRIMEPYLPLTPEVAEAIQSDGSFQENPDAPAQFVDTTAAPEAPAPQPDGSGDVLDSTATEAPPDDDEPPPESEPQ